MIGRLFKRMTVGYRSPWLLETDDGGTIEVRGEGLDDFEGERVEIDGVMEETQSVVATPGSEAAARFVDGRIPAMRWLSARAIRKQG